MVTLKRQSVDDDLDLYRADQEQERARLLMERGWADIPQSDGYEVGPWGQFAAKDELLAALPPLDPPNNE